MVLEVLLVILARQVLQGMERRAPQGIQVQQVLLVVQVRRALLDLEPWGPQVLLVPRALEEQRQTREQQALLAHKAVGVQQVM